MLAYQAEKRPAPIGCPTLPQSGARKERTLLQSALASAADLHLTNTELRVTLALQSSPHRTRAIAALCNQLNQTKNPFPGLPVCVCTTRFGKHPETKSGHFA